MIDTKEARELADEYRTNHVGAECIRELADEVDRLRKEAFDYRDGFMETSAEVDRLLAAAKVVQHGDCDSSAPYKALREAIEACEEGDHRAHMDLCREQMVELLEAKMRFLSKGVDHEDE